MKVIAISNQKGGVGKTTKARNLTFYGARKRGLRVLGVDLDVQGNYSTTFHNVAEEKGLAGPENPLLVSQLFADDLGGRLPVKVDEHIDLIAADPDITNVERRDLREIIELGQARFAELAPYYDLCVIDTGPSVSNLLILALALADFAVSPCDADRDSIAGLSNFFMNVVRVRDESGINPNLASLGVLPNKVHPHRSYDLELVDQMRAVWPTGVLPVTLYDRDAIKKAKDRPVWETSRGESRSIAAKEVLAACECIFERMGF